MAKMMIVAGLLDYLKKDCAGQTRETFNVLNKNRNGLKKFNKVVVDRLFPWISKMSDLATKMEVENEQTHIFFC